MTKSTRQAVPSDAASSRKGDAKPRKKARRFPISWRKWNWVEHLIAHPEDASVCPWWSFFDGGDWRSLLAAHPEFADRCDWSKLEGWEWSHLLAARPEFADRCDWSKFDGESWLNLLLERPEYADKCAWDTLDGNDWTLLLCNQPQFADRFDILKVSADFDEDAWNRFLFTQPQLADKTLIVSYGETDRRYRGLGYTIEVTLQFVSAKSHEMVCSCTAEGQGETEADDIRMAIQRAISGLFRQRYY